MTDHCKCAREPLWPTYTSQLGSEPLRTQYAARSAHGVLINGITLECLGTLSHKLRHEKNAIKKALSKLKQGDDHLSFA
eukprot:5399863-Amphidinium_carterae.1